MEVSTKSINQSLNLYSIFGYLLPGFFLISLFVVDYDSSILMRYYHNNGSFSNFDIKFLKINYGVEFFSSGSINDIKFISFVIFMFFCYLLGHIVSAFSSLFIERLLLKNTLGFPSALLFSENQKKRIFFPTYSKKLKPNMIVKIKSLMNETFNYNVCPDDYYWLCYSFIITSRPYLAPRLHHFINLYGFSRNIASAILMYILFRFFVLFCFLHSSIDIHSFVTLIILFLACLFMLWNYLKLFKRQAIDIYYLFLSVKNNKEDSDPASSNIQ